MFSGLYEKIRPVRRREMAHLIQDTFSMSCVRACRLAQFGRASWYRWSRSKDQSALRMRICDLAHAVLGLAKFASGGYCAVKAGRLSCMEAGSGYGGPNKRWSGDFVHDTLADGQPFRSMTAVDNGSWHSPIRETGF